MLYWLANNNFFSKYTFIRKIQCNIFGHNWYTWTINKTGPYCAWCGRITEKHPKMRKRI